MGALPSREVLMGSSVKKGKRHERRQVSSHPVPAFRDSAGVAGSPVEKNVLEMYQSGLVLWKVGSRLQGLLWFCVFCPESRDPVCRREHWILPPVP